MASGERVAADHPAADLIAAVLAVTPVDPSADSIGVVTEWLPVPDELTAKPGAEWTEVWGDPTPIAARQAVVVLRWAAEWLREPWMERNADSLDDLADAIEAAR